MRGMPLHGRYRHAVSMLASLVVLAACDDEPKKQAAASASAPAPVSDEPAQPGDPPPRKCQATGDEPMQLGTGEGTLHGLTGDATHLYYGTWDRYGRRGDLVRLRKDGGGLRNLTSVTLEPRDIAVDESHVYYTEGIRLKRIAKQGGDATTVDDNFSSQSIERFGGFVYGVPGNYGPYDRFVRQPTKGGPSKELDVAERPEVKDGPAGYSALTVDASGAYVTDSGSHRILRFELDRAKPKTVVGGQPGAYALAAVGDRLYFSLALKGELLVVPKRGGKARRLASGLVRQGPIAADGTGVVAPFAGAGEEAPVALKQVSSEGGELRPIATLPKRHSVQALAVDEDCVYWAQREAGAGKLAIFARAK